MLDTHTHTRAHMDTHQHPLQNKPWALYCMSGSCRLMEVVCQVPLATHSDCEICFCTLCLLIQNKNVTPQLTPQMCIYSTSRQIMSLGGVGGGGNIHLVPCEKGQKVTNIPVYISLLWQYYSAFTNTTQTPPEHTIISFGKSSGT